MVSPLPRLEGVATAAGRQNGNQGKMQEAVTHGMRQVVPCAVGLGCPLWVHLPGGRRASAPPESWEPTVRPVSAVARRCIVADGAV